MKYKEKIRVDFHAPLFDRDTELITIGCRHTNPEICRSNGIPSICALVREDGICYKPSSAWKKQYNKLKKEMRKK